MSESQNETVEEPQKETPQKQETVVGELTEEEQTVLVNFQQKANQLLYRLGEMEVRKHGLLQEISVVEQNAAAHLRQIGARFGLAENQLFRVLNGKVTLVGPPKPRIVKG